MIEARPRPLLVVAGAGSGKTETMAARVVWLVANGLVAPDQVLGLTFTRKAAAELVPAHRASGCEVWSGWPLDAARGRRQRGRGAGRHADASRRTTRMLAGSSASTPCGSGLEPEFRVLTEAGAWQLAAEAVSRWTGRWRGVQGRVDRHRRRSCPSPASWPSTSVTPSEVIDHLDAVIAAHRRPSRRRGHGEPVAGQGGARRAARAARGRCRSSTPSCDSSGSARRWTSRTRWRWPHGSRPDGAARRAGRARAVQGRPARRVPGHLGGAADAPARPLPRPVRWPSRPSGTPTSPSTAGGGRARRRCCGSRPSSPAGRGPADVLPLSTSWRNDELILAAANVSAGPAGHGPCPAAPAAPRSGTGRDHDRARRDGRGRRQRRWQPWIASRWRSPSGRRTGRSAAVLCRRRSSFPLVMEALRDAGLPVEVVGLGGLLTTPEVSDLVALLWVVQDPTRGDQLMRLLTGPVARLGAADLDALWAWARELHSRPWRVGHPALTQDALPIDTGTGESGPADGSAAHGRRLGLRRSAEAGARTPRLGPRRGQRRRGDPRRGSR